MNARESLSPPPHAEDDRSHATGSRRLVGVIDLMEGLAVRAVGGRREEYRPIRSRLTETGDALQVAGGYRERYGIEDLYVADLDAILGRSLNDDVLRGLVAEGFRISVDRGLRCAEDADRVCDLGVESLVVALETLPEPETLAVIVDRVGRERVIFSLDLANGVPLASAAVWREEVWDVNSPIRLAQSAVKSGVERLIVLDLVAVGTGGGPATVELCRQLRAAISTVRVWTGGGVRGREDVEALCAAGAEKVLVASALHDGTL